MRFVSSRVAAGAALERAVTVAALAAAVLLTIACGGNDKPTPSGPPLPFSIDVGTDETFVKPNESRQVVFVLRDANGQPVPGRVMQLLIVDATQAKGATLSLDRGVTGAAGDISVQIIGGQPTEFTVRAQTAPLGQAAPDAVKDLRVRVTAQDSGAVAVAADLAIGAGVTGIAIGRVVVGLFEGAACINQSLTHPVPNAIARTTTLGKDVVFGAVSAVGGHAVVGQGFDAAGVLVVAGCVDMSGSAIHAETAVRVELPMAPLGASPVGRFAALSQLQFSEPPLPLRTLRAAWHALDACDYDPGRLWLDCTVDALGPASADDPLDCMPSAADEAAFDGKLTARRGLTLGTSDSRCRQSTDGAGHASIEQAVAAMFTGSKPLLASVKVIAGDGNKLLDGFRVRSVLAINPTSQPGHLQLEHQLTTLEFTLGADTLVATLAEIGAAVPLARFVPVDANRTDITVDRHGFTLRLGSLTRLAFIRDRLVKNGFPADTTKFVQQVFGAASYLDRGTTYRGCPALSALVCPQVAAADGCLNAACEAGLAALGKSLSAAFDGLDGDDLDFFLQGAAPLLDKDGDGNADSVGYLLAAPGVWKGLLRLDDNQFAVSGFFAADRIVP